MFVNSIADAKGGCARYAICEPNWWRLDERNNRFKKNLWYNLLNQNKNFKQRQFV